MKLKNKQKILKGTLIFILISISILLIISISRRIEAKREIIAKYDAKKEAIYVDKNFKIICPFCKAKGKTNLADLLTETPATYQSDGRLIFHCKACSSTTTIKLPKTSGGKTDENDKKITIICPTCKKKNTNTTNQATLQGISSASCAKDGHILFYCSVCKERNNVALRALSHNPIDLSSPVVKTPATCTAGEWSYTKQCKNCGVYTGLVQTAKPTEHNYVNGKCACGAIQPNSSPSPSSSPSQDTSAHVHTWIDATCETPKHCSSSGCDATEGEALGHDFVNGKCTRCGELAPEGSNKWDLTVNGDNSVYAELKEDGTLEIRVTEGGDGIIADYEKPGTTEDKTKLCPITGRDKIKKVHIYDGVKNIGSYLFYWCTNIEEVIIKDPDGIEQIGEGAFFGCKNLKKIKHENNNREYIPVFNNLTAIEARAFCHCHNLEEIHFEYCTKLTRIGHEAFRDCWKLETVKLPEGLKIIGYEAFFNCISLKNVIIPSTVVALGTKGEANTEDGIGTKEQLTGTESTNNTTGYNNVFAIDFSRNSGTEHISYLKEIAARYSVTYTEVPNVEDLIKTTRAWYYSNSSDAITNYMKQQNSTEIEIKELKWDISENHDGSIIATLDKEGKLDIQGIGAIEDYIHKVGHDELPEWNEIRSLIKSVNIGKGITKVGANLCYYSSAQSVSLPETLEEIGEGAFFGCTILGEIEIPDSVTKIGGIAFCHCHKLEEITIPEGVKNIYLWTFRDCYNLKKVILKGDVIEFGEKAFYNCPQLENFTVSPFITEVGTDVFKVDFSNNTDTAGKAMKEKIDNKEIELKAVNYYTVSEKMSEYVKNNTERTFTAKNIDEITVNDTEDKITQNKGETLNTKNIQLMAGYYNGSTKDFKQETEIQEGYECSPTKLETAGEQEITVKYGGAQTKFKMHVHDWDKDNPTVESPTCTKGGYTSYKCKCEGCKESYTEDETEPLGHEWDEGTETKAATCTEKGTKICTCKRCDKTEEKEIPALGHREVIDEKVNPTCTKAGKTEGKHCSVCNAVLVKQEETPALGHDFANGSCTRCGEKENGEEPEPTTDKLRVTSEIYKISSDNYILGIRPNTTIENLLKGIETNTVPENIKVYEGSTEIEKGKLIGTNMQIVFTKGTEQKTYTAVVRGDLTGGQIKGATGDGKITNSDILMLAQYRVKIIDKLNDAILKAADVNFDGKFGENSDLLMMAKVLVKLIDI